jgi:DNA-binding MarR family transcriptional regulator
VTGHTDADASAGGSPESDAAQLFEAVRAVARALDDSWRALATQAGMTVSEVAALGELHWTPGPVGTSDIRSRTGLTAAAVTSLVDRRQERDLVRRVSLPQDRRRVLVEMTATGRRFTRGLFAPLLGVMEQGLDDPRLPPPAVRVQCLRHIADVLEVGVGMVSTGTESSAH